MPVSRNKPPPSAPPVEYKCAPPPNLSTLTFRGAPVRRILTPEDQALFMKSPTHDLILNFITDLNQSVYNQPNSSVSGDSLPPFITELSRILDAVRDVVDANPPVDAGGSRFGNKGFQSFYDAVWDKADMFHSRLELSPGAIDEVKRYFCESWGNRTRIDYGSGHELNFLSWLLCFYQLGRISPPDYPAVVLHLFLKYIHLMRHIQTSYYLEPAGSHGVWGLDDYQFLPFLFGSAQLYSHPHLRPKCIHDEDILQEFGEQYIYLGCIAFINSIKTTAGLRWHSPMLDDISSALNWAKVNGGMLKMYDKEVLGKLPIMQHFMFGALIPAPEGISTTEDGGEETENGEVVMDRDGMRHVHSTWGECCGIKVPSAIGAREQIASQQLRKMPRIPFD